MTDEEAFHAFLSGLQPHLQEHVGAHVQGDLEAAIAMAQRLEIYRSGDGAKTSGKGPKKFKNQKKGNVAQVEGSSSGGTFQVVQVMKKHPKKGKGGVGSGGGGEDEGKCNATIVAATISCEIARSGRRLRRNFVLPRGKSTPAPFAHTDWVTGMEPLDRQ